jgi:hypothetical protein
MQRIGLLIVFILLSFLTLLSNALQSPAATGSNINPFSHAASEDTSVNSLVAAQSVANLSIKRIELYFENRRADTTIMRNSSDLKAFADITFTGSGLFQGHWQVDGRILSYVNQHLTFGGSVTIQTPKIPPLPTFDTGTHIVKFVISNPPESLPLPSILYFVKADEFKGSPIAIKLVSPSDESMLEYGPVKFEWGKTNTLSTYSIQFYEDPKSKPVFSFCTGDTSYTFSESVLTKIFNPGRKYYWIVTGGGPGDEIGESQIRWFIFKTDSINVP